ncbi:MAG: NAD-dependent deacylase [Acidobacteriaceae bacterium]|nr:NAD-dependent deacylase [Acidobacteriaceae bacterium]MBV9498985.1 NAD-dependent deacylase [Acidobacteriaceae bacterium]
MNNLLVREPVLQQAAALLRSARSLAVLTGAGISAESGIPTFRGAGGLWKNFRPEQLATPEAFESNPELVWEWYDWRRRLINEAKPNAGHEALVILEQHFSALTVITQNVDGLHRQAGSASVLEVHGSIWRVRCTKCRDEWEDRRVPIPCPPRCKCGGIVRPGVVWFGEALPMSVWHSAECAISQCDVMLVVGTSAIVYPAAGLVPLARETNARVIEVNTERTAMSDSVDLALTGPAAEILPLLVNRCAH